MEKLGEMVYQKMMELGLEDETLLVLLVAEQTNTCSADVMQAWELYQDSHTEEM